MENNKNIQDQPLSGYGLYDTLLMQLKSHPDYLTTGRLGIDNLNDHSLNFGEPFSYWDESKADIVVPLMVYQAQKLLGIESEMFKLQFEYSDDADWNTSLYNDWLSGEITFAEMVKQADDNWGCRPLAPLVRVQDLEKYNDRVDIGIPYKHDLATEQEIEEIWNKVKEMPCVKDTMNAFRDYVYKLVELNERVTSTLSIDPDADDDLNRIYLDKVNFPIAYFDEPNLDEALVYGHSLICTHLKSEHDEANLCVKTDGLLTYSNFDDSLHISKLWAEDHDALNHLMNKLQEISKACLKPITYSHSSDYVALEHDHGVSLPENHPMTIKLADNIQSQFYGLARFALWRKNHSDNELERDFQLKIAEQVRGMLNKKTLNKGSNKQIKDVQDLHETFYQPAEENARIANEFAEKMVKKYNFAPLLREIGEKFGCEDSTKVRDYALSEPSGQFQGLLNDVDTLVKNRYKPDMTPALQATMKP